MSARLAARIAHCKAAKRPAFVGFITAGFPTKEHTVPNLVAMQAGGADIIELGIPFSDPLADGPTIQQSSTLALDNGISVAGSIELVKAARAAGVTVPIVFMGYVNPMLAYGFDKLANESKEAGVDGFIICDVPAEAAQTMIESLNKHQLSFVPLVTPATRDERIARLAALATGFIYVVSANGVTGQKDKMSDALPDFLSRVRKHTELPLMVGFGISKRQHVEEVGKLAEGVIVGSAIVSAAKSAGENASPEATAEKLKELISTMVGGTVLEATPDGDTTDTVKLEADMNAFKTASNNFMFGDFGGRYIPETLVDAHERLYEEWLVTKEDPAYLAELARLRKDYVGGPTPIFKCENLTKIAGGAQIWLKREDLAHTGAHKINNALGQTLLAKRLGKKRIIAETGAGQHGVATATACALLDLECVIYMGAVDMQRQSLNVFKMQVLGAKCIPVTAGSQTLKDAVNEAMRDWVTNVDTTHYIIGSAVGPHPFPEIVRDLQSVIGKEARSQFVETTGKLPDVVMACVGGGSNAIGMFHPFKDDKEVQLVGIEAGGEKGVAGGPGTHSLTLSHGTPGVLHGMTTFILQDHDGQVMHTHSVSAGMDYPAVGPEHAFFKSIGRAQYVGINDDEALEAFKQLSEKEGIIPALESAHAVAHAMKVAKTLSTDKTILINLSGRGDKDMLHVAKILGVSLNV